MTARRHISHGRDADERLSTGDDCPGASMPDRCGEAKIAWRVAKMSAANMFSLDREMMRAMPDDDAKRWYGREAFEHCLCLSSRDRHDMARKRKTRQPIGVIY